MVRGAGHDIGVRAVEVEDNDGSVIGEHAPTRSDLVNQTADANLPEQEHGLTRHEPLAVLRHTSYDAESARTVSIPNLFLTAG
jgi:hypothetical protein